MAIDPNTFAQSSTTQPAAEAVAVTPADVDLAQYSRAIYVGVTGDLVVTMAGAGNQVTFKNVAAGIPLPLRVSQVNAATTATDVVVLF